MRPARQDYLWYLIKSAAKFWNTTMTTFWRINCYLFIFVIFEKCGIPLCVYSDLFKKFLCWKNGVLQSWIGICLLLDSFGSLAKILSSKSIVKIAALLLFIKYYLLIKEGFERRWRGAFTLRVLEKYQIKNVGMLHDIVNGVWKYIRNLLLQIELSVSFLLPLDMN